MTTTTNTTTTPDLAAALAAYRAGSFYWQVARDYGFRDGAAARVALGPLRP